MSIAACQCSCCKRHYEANSKFPTIFAGGGELELKQQLETTQKQLDAAIEGLEFYARLRNWRNSGNKNMNRMHCFDTDQQSFEVDGYHYDKVLTGGKTARESLEQIKLIELGEKINNILEEK